MPTILNDVENEIEIKKSRFITYLHKTNDLEEAKEFLKQVKKAHPHATHHCTAMILSNTERSSDDGEPAGTAGRPMLDVLQGQNIQQILAIVVRYFGGTLLGKGGLVKAYSTSVSQALQKAVLMENKIVKEYQIEFGYEWIGKIDAYFRRQNLEPSLKEYQELVLYQYAAEKDFTDDLLELSNGTIKPRFIQERELEVPL